MNTRNKRTKSSDNECNKRRKEVETSVEEQALKAAEKVVLDIGGEKFSTSRSTLTSHPGSFFEVMLANKNWKPDPKEGYFIDRNPAMFPIILEYLRNGKIALKKFSHEVIEDLKTELEFYNIEIPELYCSNLLNRQQEEQLLEWTKKSKLLLIYSGSRDGFEAKAFHEICDYKGPTITVIQSNTYLFGGYASTSWDSSNTYKSAPGSFLFTLTNPHLLQPTKYPINSAMGNNHILCNSTCGPTFGGGNDLQIVDECKTNYSNCRFPYSFADTTGRGNTTFTGANSFAVTDIEVLLVK